MSAKSVSYISAYLQFLAQCETLTQTWKSGP